MRYLIASSLLFASLFGLPSLGDDIPPQSSKPLSAILASVTKAGYEAITEASFDDGQWEVEALKEGRPVGLRVDPQTAKVLHDHADEPHPRLRDEMKPMSAIVERLESAGYAPIKKAEFETTGWEVEAFHDGSWRELIVDLDGKIVADRFED